MRGANLFQFTPARGGRPPGVFAIALQKAFQFTPARGGRRKTSSKKNGIKSFNSRPRVAGDTEPQVGDAIEMVSIHARAWRATDGTLRPIIEDDVSIHARAWRATWVMYMSASMDWFQFTPARGGRPSFCEHSAFCVKFQFTPARGGRLLASSLPKSIERFNSRPRVAGDAVDHLQYAPILMFQFTPARGGRHGRSPRLALESDKFQFTPARGGRPWQPLQSPFRQCFNSRPRVAGDRRRAPSSDLRRCFNSRPRVAGDANRFATCNCNGVSIHARAWRATSPTSTRRNGSSVSIHARAWRATETQAFDPRRIFVSIHARARRATVWRVHVCYSHGCFNSRPRVAGDVLHLPAHERDGVSIHARAWRATGIANSTSFIMLVSIHARAWRATVVVIHEAAVVDVSIHARAWRATGEARAWEVRVQVSIHARAWRATLAPAVVERLLDVSIHARAWRATTVPATPMRLFVFQFTPARGGRR